MIWQRTRRRRLEELIRSAKSEYSLTEDYQERVTAAINHAPALTHTRSRKRVIALVAMVAVALFGLGFVPIPMGKAPGALERALAASEDVRGVYLRYKGREGGREFISEVWQGPGGLRRYEMREDGELVDISLHGRDMGGIYHPRRKEAFLHDTPPTWDWYEGLPNRSFHERRWLYGERKGHYRLDEEVAERRELSLWGGKRDIVDVEGFGLLIRYEFESQTGRLVSETHYQSVGDSWQPVYWTEEVLWDIEIPESTWTFDLPAGTTVHWNRWWVGRTEDVIAGGENQDWQVRLNAIDMDRDGDLYLTLSRIPQPERFEKSWNGGGPIDVIAAVDNIGVRYELENGCSCVRDYWARRLSRGKSNIPVGIAKTITLTIQPYSANYAEADGEVPGEPVVLYDVPLPRPQDSEDLFVDREEVIQY